jgi:Rnl2 family RNA ligase
MKKYPSIMKEREIGDAPSDVKWIVTEKLHGSNLQFRLDPSTKSVRTFRRLCELHPGEKFYGAENLPERVRPRLVKLLYHFPSEVSVFGELIGGHYPGFPKTKTMIQKNIYYCPDHEFVVFDIYDYGSGRFLDFDDMTVLCEKVKLHVIRPWFPRSKTMDEIMNLDHENEQTRAPTELFNLKPVPNNFIEGWVIRPERELLTPRGSRVMFKRRTKRFLKRGQSKEWSENHEKLLDQENADILARVPDLLTLALWENAKSKELENEKSISKFIDLIYEDVVDELQVEPAPDVRKKMRKMIAKFVQAMLLL